MDSISVSSLDKSFSSSSIRSGKVKIKKNGKWRAFGRKETGATMKPIGLSPGMDAGPDLGAMFHVTNYPAGSFLTSLGAGSPSKQVKKRAVTPGQADKEADSMIVSAEPHITAEENDDNSANAPTEITPNEGQ